MQSNLPVRFDGKAPAVIVLSNMGTKPQDHFRLMFGKYPLNLRRPRYSSELKRLRLDDYRLFDINIANSLPEDGTTITDTIIDLCNTTNTYPLVVVMEDPYLFYMGKLGSFERHDRRVRELSNAICILRQMGVTSIFSTTLGRSSDKGLFDYDLWQITAVSDVCVRIKWDEEKNLVRLRYVKIRAMPEPDWATDIVHIPGSRKKRIKRIS